MRSSLSTKVRSETIRPSIGSTGQVAHQPRTAARRPAVSSMFQIAGTLRSVEFNGTLPSGVGTTKSTIPCRSATVPVATLVQITADLLW